MRKIRCFDFTSMARRKVRRAYGLRRFPLVPAERWLVLALREFGKPVAAEEDDMDRVVLRWSSGTTFWLPGIVSAPRSPKLL